MLSRYLTLLETLVAAGEPLSAGDLARLTKLPRPTCYRLVAALEQDKLIDRVDGEARYLLGARFVKIALLGKSDTHVRRAVSSLMDELVLQSSETAFFSRYRGGRVDLIHVETPKDPRTTFIYPGLGERPAHACSSAKVIAAYAPDDIREMLLSGARERYTSATLTEHDAILADLNLTRRRGYAICDGELDDGVVSIAVPIQIDKVGAVFSLGVVGPSKRVHSALDAELVDTLKRAAVRASSAIQHCTIMEAEQLQRM